MNCTGKCNGIEQVAYVDLWGILRSKMVPLSNINAIAKHGAGFAGFASWMDLTPAHSDLVCIPDPATLVQLPWNMEIGWMVGDLYVGGKILEHAPRRVLKNQIESAKHMGYTYKTAVECEFFLLTPEKTVTDPYDTLTKPCYDQLSLFRRIDLFGKILTYMDKMGWKPLAVDHEDGNGQFEVNWEYDDCLVTADRHTFFKFMVKTLAETHGFRATFMPKPFFDQSGTGAHAHVSLHDLKDGRNLFLGV
eukprot:TRINITY_DN2357_c0_g1_i2.p1 TRINITY_DN2357_c0_g1~~TRINITY_DN2357_c0_g1_i2.p1  ORF type:complete len:248 (-),score=34.94 TRINITY_DN2357_c0_g1_i2:923-1666(-)